MKRTLILIITIISVILLIGCEPEQNSNTQQQAAETQQQAQQQNTGGSGDSSFIDFAKANQGATFKVDYDFTSSGAGQQMSGTLSMAQKGSKKKISTEVAQGSGEIYYLDKIYSCSDAQGSMQCFAISENEAAKDQALEIAENAQQSPDDFTIQTANVISIAGTSAQCFVITSKTENSKVDICYEQHGVPLYMKFSGSAQGQVFESTMQATSFSTSVSDSEFNLPADPTDLTEVMGQIPEGIDISQYT